MQLVIDRCNQLKVPVLIDCAYFGTCKGISFDFNQACIQVITFSLSKIFPVVYARIGMRLTRNYDDDTFAEHEVFLLEREKEFKYGKGREVLAISDGGKNRWDKAVKYVKYFYLYENNGKMKANDKTYTYSHEKAAEMWKTKVAEGFNRVI